MVVKEINDGMVAQWVALPSHSTMVATSILSFACSPYVCVGFLQGLLLFLSLSKHMGGGRFGYAKCEFVNGCMHSALEVLVADSKTQ